MASLSKQRIASLLGIAIGLLSIFAGSKVLLGISVPAYIVLKWLVAYNLILGFVSVAAGIGLWKGHTAGLMFAILIAISHGIILIALSMIYLTGGAVAIKSILAMVFRTAVWLLIIMLARKTSAAD